MRISLSVVLVAGPEESLMEDKCSGREASVKRLRTLSAPQRF